jgi:Zn-dependent protease
VFLAEPPATSFDFHFQIFGIPVRVTPFFWVAAAVLGWDFAAWLDRQLDSMAGSSLEVHSASNPGQGMLLLLWIAAVFASILVHELGHSLMMRGYGIRSYIVLYHFGGLAVPDTAKTFVRFGGFTRPQQQIAISAAGPAAQLLLVAVLVLALRLSDAALLWSPTLLDPVVSVTEGRQIPSAPLQALLLALLVPNVGWALLNLLPIYPLDGGQIARELFSLFDARDGTRNSLILSVVAGAGVAVYAYTSGDVFLAMMFAMLAYSSYQVLQAFHGRGGPW